MINRLFLIAILVLLGACSSLRKPVQPEAKADADNTLHYALAQENQGRDSAIDGYKNALAKYRCFAGIEGEAWALAGMARIQSADGDSLACRESLNMISGIIRDIDPGLGYILDLTRLQILAARNDWSAMLPYLNGYDAAPVLVKMHILSYGVQAKAYLNDPDPALANALAKLYDKIRKKAHKKGPDQALGVANAAYSLACHYYVRKDHSRALKLVEAALELDYLYGNFRGLGYDLWLKGRIHLAGGDTTSARSALLKSQRVFDSMQNAAMLRAVQAELDSITEGDGQ